MRFKMTELNISTVFDMDHEPDLDAREQKYTYNYNQFVEQQEFGEIGRANLDHKIICGDINSAFFVWYSNVRVYFKTPIVHW